MSRFTFGIFAKHKCDDDALTDFTIIYQKRIAFFVLFLFYLLCAPQKFLCKSAAFFLAFIWETTKKGNKSCNSSLFVEPIQCHIQKTPVLWCWVFSKGAQNTPTSKFWNQRPADSVPFWRIPWLVILFRLSDHRKLFSLSYEQYTTPSRSPSLCPRQKGVTAGVFGFFLFVVDDVWFI